jgi:hypothetical protein
MLTPDISVTLDAHVVRRIEDRAVSLPSFADHLLQEGHIAPVAAPDPMFTQRPDVTMAGSRLASERRDDLVIRVFARVQENVNFSARKSRRAEIDFDVQGHQLAKLEPE